jgi:hypothetical protein
MAACRPSARECSPKCGRGRETLSLAHLLVSQYRLLEACVAVKRQVTLGLGTAQVLAFRRREAAGLGSPRARRLRLG